MVYVTDKSEAYVWQQAWFFSMNKKEQRALITPYVVEGFVKENDENFGANHIYGLSVSLNYITGSCDESEELLQILREQLIGLAWKFKKSRDWGFDAISETKEWKAIRKTAKEALVKDGYRVSPPRKPLMINEYPDHFLELK